MKPFWLIGLSGWLVCWRLAAVDPVPLTLEQLTRQADVIFQGTVRSKSCQRDSDGRIYTKVLVQIESVWKGSVAADPFPVVHGGGILGRHKTVIPGQAQFEIGEEIVAFLARNSRGEGVPVGLSQGKFRIWQKPGSEAKFVQNSFLGASPATVGRAQAARPAGDFTLRLSELRSRVDELR